MVRVWRMPLPICPPGLAQWLGPPITQITSYIICSIWFWSILSFSSKPLQHFSLRRFCCICFWNKVTHSDWPKTLNPLPQPLSSEILGEYTTVPSLNYQLFKDFQSPRLWGSGIWEPFIQLVCAEYLLCARPWSRCLKFRWEHRYGHCAHRTYGLYLQKKFWDGYLSQSGWDPYSDWPTWIWVLDY